MRVTMVGHASLLFETADISILTDPLLFDPHQRDVFCVNPTRRVELSALPKFDVLVISHQHLDHFDVQSLTALPTDCEVIFPKDPLIDRTLEKLGFRTRIPLDDWTTISYGSTTITTTASLCPVPEFGMVVRDLDGIYWNQVDSIVDDAIIATVRDQIGAIDVLHCPWQPLLESAYIWSQPTSFPYDIYRDILRRIARAQAPYIVPGASGFSYTGHSAWLNRVAFPVTRERFSRDAAAIANSPEGVLPLNPGDVLELVDGTARLRHQASGWVHTLVDDRDRLEFVPNQVESRLSERNGLTSEHPDGQALIARVHADLQSFVRAQKDAILSPLVRWGVVYELLVVFSDTTVALHADFGRDEIVVQPGKTPLALYRTHISASALSGLVDGTESWSVIITSGEYRTCNTTAMVTNGGLTWPSFDDIGDPLWHAYPHMPRLEGYIQQEIERYSIPH